MIFICLEQNIKVFNELRRLMPSNVNLASYDVRIIIHLAPYFRNQEKRFEESAEKVKN